MLWAGNGCDENAGGTLSPGQAPEGASNSGNFSNRSSVNSSSGEPISRTLPMPFFSRGQALLLDGVLALLLVSYGYYALTAPAPTLDTKALRASAAAYDLTNYILSDRELYENITRTLDESGSISGGSLERLKGSLVTLGRMLRAERIDFEVVGAQAERIFATGRYASHAEEACFPLVLRKSGRVRTGCLKVWF